MDGTANNAINGNIRVGSIVAPTATLDVTGTFAVSGGFTGGGGFALTSSNAGITLTNTASSSKQWSLSTSGNDFRVNETGVAARMAFVAGGFVGVGYTADPTSGNKFGVNGNTYLGGDLNITGTTNMNSLTASQAVFTDASKNLVSNAITGSGSVVMSVSPALTGTPTTPTPTFSTTATTIINQEYLPLGVPAILSTTTGINTKTSANYGLYTVPSGKTAVITAVIVRCTAATSITVCPTVTVAYVGNTIYPSTALTALKISNDVFGFSTVGSSRAVTSGNTVAMSVDTVATGTAQTVEVTVIGYLR